MCTCNPQAEMYCSVYKRLTRTVQGREAVYHTAAQAHATIERLAYLYKRVMDARETAHQHLEQRRRDQAKEQHA